MSPLPDSLRLQLAKYDKTVPKAFCNMSCLAINSANRCDVNNSQKAQTCLRSQAGCSLCHEQGRHQ